MRGEEGGGTSDCELMLLLSRPSCRRTYLERGSGTGQTCKESWSPISVLSHEIRSLVRSRLVSNSPAAECVKGQRSEWFTYFFIQSEPTSADHNIS